ncbi:hypothetical protein L2E82_12977 [Cichorium intybus]|uniref:Uncharacterized protein n=1 Tax=Cichorium intybus TaxID=13427 RepID=A0ACB9GHC8_CICIN|nr:hypothetical protein L2E82_12977 [Cichorium intybus]
MKSCCLFRAFAVATIFLFTFTHPSTSSTAPICAFYTTTAFAVTRRHLQHRKKVGHRGVSSESRGSESGAHEKGCNPTRFEYFGWVYHLGTNSIGREFCHLRFLYIRQKYVMMYKRDPHESPGICWSTGSLFPDIYGGSALTQISTSPHRYQILIIVMPQEFKFLRYPISNRPPACHFSIQVKGVCDPSPVTENTALIKAISFDEKHQFTSNASAKVVVTVKWV